MINSDDDSALMIPNRRWWGIAAHVVVPIVDAVSHRVTDITYSDVLLFQRALSRRIQS